MKTRTLSNLQDNTHESLYLKLTNELSNRKLAYAIGYLCGEAYNKNTRQTQYLRHILMKALISAKEWDGKN